MKTQAVSVLLFWGLNMVLAQSIVQFGDGGDLQLNPVNPPKPITGITWKHEGNIVAEWINGSVDLTFLGILDKTRAKLDLTNGQLSITRMKKSDEGQYTVEINNKVQSVGFTVKEVKPVPEPEVIVRPLTCSALLEECKLSCEARPSLDDQLKLALPVEYFWKLGDAEWVPSVKDKNITKSKDSRIETFSCKVKNKISEKKSLPLANPFNKEPAPDSDGGMMVGIIVGVFAALCVVLGALGYIYREKVRPYFNCKDEPGGTEMGRKTPETDKLNPDA